MGLDVTYKGSQIAQLTEDGNLTLETAGKYCEGDIELAYTGGGSGDDAVVTFIESPIEGVFENSKVTRIRDAAFAYCISLTSANFPACTSIGSSAFNNCYNLTSISFPICTSIGEYAFNDCNLTSVNFPACTSIGNNAFNNCKSLTSANFPACTSIGNSAFTYCSSLTSVDFPACTSIGSNAFNNCRSLTIAIFSASQTAQSIYSMAFARCYNLLSLYLLASTMYNLQNINVFSSTPISTYTISTGGVNGSIFVKESLYASYIAATNLATYSARFVSLTDTEVNRVMETGTHLT